MLQILTKKNIKVIYVFSQLVLFDKISFTGEIMKRDRIVKTKEGVEQ